MGRRSHGLVIPGHHHLVDFHRGAHVLQRPGPDAGQRERELVLDVVIDLSSYADSAVFGERFDSRCDIHCVPRDVAHGFHYVSQVHACAQVHPLLLGE